MKIAIHQPNFFPWMPFFEKIRSVDLFIIMVYCQYTNRNFQNRFNYGGKWFTMPVKNAEHRELIINKRYIDPVSSFEAITRKFPRNKKCLDYIRNIVNENVVDTNVSIIKYVNEKLSIETPIAFDYPTDLNSTQRLVDICKRYGANTYLSGVGARKYMDLSLFQENDISVEFQDVSQQDALHSLDLLD
jgi:hypothetical protein